MWFIASLLSPLRQQQKQMPHAEQDEIGREPWCMKHAKSKDALNQFKQAKDAEPFVRRAFRSKRTLVAAWEG